MRAIIAPAALEDMSDTEVQKMVGSVDDQLLKLALDAADDGAAAVGSRTKHIAYRWATRAPT